MRFEVPQFIEIEDKIIGPLTWKQFIYLAGGVGILAIFFFVFPFVLFLMLGIPLAGLSVFLAFHRVNNRPFSVFLESFVSYVRKSKLYLWQKETPQSIVTKTEPTHFAEPTLAYTNKKTISSLSRKLDLHQPDL